MPCSARSTNSGVSTGEDEESQECGIQVCSPNAHPLTSRHTNTHTYNTTTAKTDPLIRFVACCIPAMHVHARHHHVHLLVVSQVGKEEWCQHGFSGRIDSVLSDMKEKATVLVNVSHLCAVSFVLFVATEWLQMWFSFLQVSVSRSQSSR